MVLKNDLIKGQGFQQREKVKWTNLFMLIFTVHFVVIGSSKIVFFEELKGLYSVKTRRDWGNDISKNKHGVTWMSWVGQDLRFFPVEHL